jgi:sarcosine oxidase, subunit delta
MEWGGEAGIVRPDPSSSDEAWSEYLYFRRNSKGAHLELWNCAGGCGQWFILARNTVTHDVLVSWPMTDKPDLAAAVGRKLP